MSEEYRKGSHTVYDIQYHFVWVTKYRYPILKGEVALKPRDLIQQMWEARSITILSGHVSKDHIHIHVSCPPELAPSKIAQYIKGRSSRLIQQEFSHFRKRYWGGHLWARGYFCATVGKVTEKMIAAYIEQQERARPKDVITVAEEESASAEMNDFQS
jgi:putative transposase